MSAYDISHGLLTDGKSFFQGFRESRYAQPGILMIDSGWYERGGGSPGSPQISGVEEAPITDNGKPEHRRWEEEDYRNVIDNLDKDLTPIVVSWDHTGSYEEQISRAQGFFGDRRNLASVLLLKPPAPSRFHNLDKLTRQLVADLRAFDIVGVTEREIGDTILDRLVSLARLRRHLNDANVQSPLHVFGGLDPLLTPLYFAAGAEVFDGLGWLRYAYREGTAMHWTAAPLMDAQIRRRFTAAQLSVPLQNLDQINRLTDDLRRFLHRGGDWGELQRGTVLKPIAESMFEKLEASYGW